MELVSLKKNIADYPKAQRRVYDIIQNIKPKKNMPIPLECLIAVIFLRNSNFAKF